jgi:DNA-binding response OmpR family regulator
VAQMIRILLVEDDERVAAALASALERDQVAVQRVATGADALAADPVDIVLLDLGLPDIDGIDVCRRLRERSDVAIIALTARASPSDRVIGLRAGADDYLLKPFSLAELNARIEAVLRRTGLAVSPPENIEIGELAIDQLGHEVTVCGRPVRLSRKEYDLLVLLATHPGRVFSRAELLLQVWHTSWEGKSRTVDVHVGLIRQKTERPELIKTVHGVGYVLAGP